MFVPHHEGLLVHRVDYGMDEETDRMAANIAMYMKEVTLAALDRITMEVKSVRKMDDRIGKPDLNLF